MGSGMGAETAADVLHIVSNGLGGEIELAGDLAISRSFSHLRQDLNLPVRESLDFVCPTTRFDAEL